LDNLSSLSSANPFPASLDVRVKVVTQVEAVATSVKNDTAVDPTYATSYDPDTYSRLRRFALIAGGIAGGIVLLFGVVAYAVIANAMRGIAAARRPEVSVTRLLGARGWMVWGPFVVEGLTTGALAGAVAAASVAGAHGSQPGSVRPAQDAAGRRRRAGPRGPAALAPDARPVRRHRAVADGGGRTRGSSGRAAGTADRDPRLRDRGHAGADRRRETGA